MSKTNSTTKMSVAEIFVQRVVDRVLTEGVLPWNKPWSIAGNGAHNALTGRYYNGLNVLTLDPDSYLTFKQVKDLGGTVKKGAKSYMVIFWKQIKVSDQTEDEDGNVADEEKTIPMMRYYNVFRVSDCEIPEEAMAKLHLDNSIPAPDGHKVPNADHLAEYYLKREKIGMFFERSDRAFYRPGLDEIHLPLREWFKDAAGLFGTWFHEITHSTGHESRLKRIGVTGSHYFGDTEYSKEELVAEIGSCFLCTYCGIDMGKEEDNSVAYLQSWLDALKKDPQMLISAHSKARKAFEFVIDGFEDWEDAPAEIAESEVTEEPVTVIESEPEPAPAAEQEDAPLPLDEAVKRLRALLKAGVITMDEFTDMVVCLNAREDGADDTAPFVPAEHVGMPYRINFDGCGERIQIRYKVQIPNIPTVIIYDARIAGLLPAPKSEEADSVSAPELPFMPETPKQKLMRVYQKALHIAMQNGVVSAAPINSVKINPRLTRSWGRCITKRQTSDGKILNIAIDVRESLVECKDETPLLLTLLHEICHTVKDGWKGHKDGWKIAAEKLTAAGYPMTATTSYAAYGL